MVDIWLGTWPDEASFASYVAEVESREDDQPLSLFAAGQGQLWYDHDFFESHFLEVTSDLQTALGNCLGYGSLAEPLAASLKRSLKDFNVAVLAYGLIFQHPRSLKKPDFVLHYMRKQPSCPPPETLTAGWSWGQGAAAPTALTSTSV